MQSGNTGGVRFLLIDAVQTNFVLTHSKQLITRAIREGKHGKLNESKDFLDSKKPGNSITRGVNSIRRRCHTVYLSTLPLDMQEELRDCEYIFMRSLYPILSCSC